MNFTPVIGAALRYSQGVQIGAALRYSQGVQLHTLTFKKIKGKKKFYIDILDKKKILNTLK
jgi:hypothetical protein